MQSRARTPKMVFAQASDVWTLSIDITHMARESVLCLLPKEIHDAYLASTTQYNYIWNVKDGYYEFPRGLTLHNMIFNFEHAAHCTWAVPCEDFWVRSSMIYFPNGCITMRNTRSYRGVGDGTQFTLEEYGEPPSSIARQLQYLTGLLNIGVDTTNVASNIAIGREASRMTYGFAIGA